MNKYIVLSLCVSLSAVLCEYLNGEEGDECEWEGLKGRCVKESTCLTTLDDDSPKHPVCSKNWGEKIVCCTDCNLVNNTNNAIFIPPSGLIWKNGQKARDICLQYLQDLPYKCKEDGFAAGLTRELNEDNGCYEYSEWEVGSSSSGDKMLRTKYPHRVLLGSSSKGGTDWVLGGAIISNKYIVTSASNALSTWGNLDYVAVGGAKRLNSTFRQTHVIKRLILHPEFDELNKGFNDIALIETKTPIKFNENVLPACLHVEDASIEDAIIAPYLWKCNGYVAVNLTDPIKTEETVKLIQCSEDECKYDQKTQMCYDHKNYKMDLPFYCKFGEPDPVLITKQLSSCVHTAIGVFMRNFNKRPEVCSLYTMILPYLPWIESIVWPDEP